MRCSNLLQSLQYKLYIPGLNNLTQRLREEAKYSFIRVKRGNSVNTSVFTFMCMTSSLLDFQITSDGLSGPHSA